MAGMFARTFAHLRTGHGVVRRRFDHDAMKRIGEAIAAAEHGHAGEIRFAVEAALPLRMLRRHQDARSRALEIFAHLRVWDTEANTGVLLYLLWADRAIEIVADRGIAALVPASDWEAVCAHVRDGLRSAHPADAVIAGITRIGELLRAALPAQESTLDELPDDPVML
ncbi:MAG TPA: TPM domain-containing protein [Xanthomonadaceae bacterium]|nr:TPM domain-containing protein [Xanthomonadaceae bacterium]